MIAHPSGERDPDAMKSAQAYFRLLQQGMRMDAALRFFLLTLYCVLLRVFVVLCA